MSFEFGQQPTAIIGNLWESNLLSKVSPICSWWTAARPNYFNKTLRSRFVFVLAQVEYYRNHLPTCKEIIQTLAAWWATWNQKAEGNSAEASQFCDGFVIAIPLGKFYFDVKMVQHSPDLVYYSGILEPCHQLVSSQHQKSVI